MGIKQLYSNSKLALSKWIIKKARYYYGETTINGDTNPDYWKNNYSSLYECLRASVKVIDKTYDIENNLLRDKIIEPLCKEKIRIERDRTMHLKFINIDNEPFLLNTTYKINKLVVKRINKYSEHILYDKNHYEMIEMRVGLSSIFRAKETAKQKEDRELMEFISDYILLQEIPVCL